jgi:N-acetylneuraminate lyase
MHGMANAELSSTCSKIKQRQQWCDCEFSNVFSRDTMSKYRIKGLVAASHTPFHANGGLNLGIVEKQAAHLLATGVTHAFIGGTTGESSSLTLEERRALAVRWREVTRDSALNVIVHVGGNCLADSRNLAALAQELGAVAVSALTPSYFKPSNVATLVESMAQIASAAPELPFYYYEIPTMTSLSLSPSEFLSQAGDRIPNLAGIKFTSSNLMEYQLCRSSHEGRFDIPFGFDEMLLAALALGATGAVGSSFNFAAPVYLRVIGAFQRGDFTVAREEQMKSVRIIQALASRGYMGAAKAVMAMLGVEVGPPRLPCAALDADQTKALRSELEQMGFFEWVKP